MSRNNTGNPIGSKAFPDFEDNVKNLDEAVNSDELSWSDRLGRPRLTFAGMQGRFNTFIASSGYQFVGDYAAGIEITEYNQLIRDSNGEFWRVSGQVDLPYVTTGAGIPEDDALVPAGDAVLRQDLAAGSAFIDGDRSDRFVREAVSDVEITVGLGGDTDNLNAALIRAMKFRNSLSTTSAAAFRVTVRILSGTVISTQVLIERGVDMGFIEIISDDPIVLVDGSNMNRQTDLKIIYVDGSSMDLPAALFFAGENSTLPIIGCLFDMQGVGPDAVVVAYNSSAYIRIGCGVINSGGRGIYALHGSHVVAHGTNFSGARLNAVSSFRGSFVDFRTANGDNAGEKGIYCGSNSRCEALDCSLKSAGVDGIEVYGAAIVHARNVDVSGAGRYGLWARDGGVISTRSPKINSTGSNAIYTLNGGKVYAPDAEIIDSGNYGIRADEGGEVCAPRAIITNSFQSALLAVSAKVDMAGSVITNAPAVAIVLEGGSVVCFAGGKINGSAGRAIEVKDASVLSTSNTEITNSGGEGIYCLGGSVVDARNCVITDPSAAGIVCAGTSRVAASGAEITGAGGVSVQALRGATVDANGATLTGSTSYAVQASRGATINVNDATVSSGSSEDIRVSRGGIVAANGVVGATTSQPANTITSGGIIFQ